MGHSLGQRPAGSRGLGRQILPSRPEWSIDLATGKGEKKGKTEEATVAESVAQTISLD